MKQFERSPLSKYCELKYWQFWLFFWPIFHILAVIEPEINWEVYFKPTYHIKPAWLKNNYIWPSNRPKSMKFGGHAHLNGHSFLAQNSAIFVQFKKERYRRTQDIIGYKQSTHLLGFDFVWQIWYFLARIRRGHPVRNDLHCPLEVRTPSKVRS